MSFLVFGVRAGKLGAGRGARRSNPGFGPVEAIFNGVRACWRRGVDCRVGTDFLFNPVPVGSCLVTEELSAVGVAHKPSMTRCFTGVKSGRVGKREEGESKTLLSSSSSPKDELEAKLDHADGTGVLYGDCRGGSAAA